MSKETKENKPFQNDHRLIQAYEEATNLDPKGLEALCPSYVELSEISTRYQDQRLIGKGGVKEVYRTFDNRTRRWIAMARLRDDRGPEFYDLFVNEAWLTSSLNHPNIISVHNVGIDADGRPFFTMDLKGNTTLAKLIADKTQDRNILLRVFLKVCDALAYAHSQDVIHLDLKPENIQTDDFGEVLVCDWGLGKILTDDEKDHPVAPSGEILDNMTLVGQIKGSPGYMAPEQIEEEGHKDHRTDIFSLGCILHTILTGEAPFTGDQQTIIEATSRGEVPDPCERFPSLKIPPSLGAITLKTLAKSPNDRYHSVSELKNDLLRYLEGFSPDAEESSFLREACLFVSRNRVPVFISSLAVILLTVLSTLFFQRLDILHQSVLEESQLADQYASEAESTNELYLDTLSKSKEEQIALSKSLIVSVKGLKNLGIFDTPMKSIRQALALANHAHKLDPKSTSAEYELFALNLIQLNFQEALNYPLQKNSHRYGYMSFARAFPDFDYNRSDRPTVDTLIEFLATAREVEPNHSPMIERMISYDAALRSSKSAYHPVIQELASYLNPGTTEIELETEDRTRELTLRTKKSIRLIADPGGSEKCILRYLNPRSLKITCPSDFNLHQLQELAIRHLDLTECPHFYLEELLSLPSLESITISSSARPPEDLRTWIQSPGDFEIIKNP